MRGLLLILFFALAGSGQTVEALARAWRETRTPARRAALLRFAASHPRSQAGALALLALGAGEGETGRHAEAMAHLRAARPRLPQLDDYIAWRLGISQFASGDFQGAAQSVARFEQGCARSSFGGRAAVLRARALREAGDDAAAVRVLERCEEQLPQPEGGLLLATAREGAGNLPAAAASYQNVYYLHPASNEAAEAEQALARLRAALGDAYPPAMPQMMMRRAERLLAAGEFRRARSEFQDLASQLAGAERDVARVRACVTDYLARDTKSAYGCLAALAPAAPEADAERLYYMAECARRLDADQEMRGWVSQLGAAHPGSEWRLRALVSAGNRYLLLNQPADYEPLYRTCYESFPSQPEAAYCHWKLAWNVYLRRGPGAADMLRDHLRRFPGSEKAPAALYFLGRVAEKSGDIAAAKAYYAAIGERARNHYYAFLAEARLKQADFVRALPSGPARAFLDSIARTERNSRPNFEASRDVQAVLERAGLLAAAALYEDAESEIRFFARNGGRNHLLAMELAKTAARRGAPDQGIRYIKAFAPDYLSLAPGDAPAEFWKLAFPMPYRRELEANAKARAIDPFVLAGLIRQESEFNPRAISRAQAYGLIQVLPSTGRELSRKIGPRRFRASLLLRPEVNLRLGTYYLRGLLDEHGGRWEPALAAYNAGNTRAKAWRTWAAYEEDAEYVETIPITETRTYVQAVLRNAEMYRRLYAAPARPRR